MHTPTLSDALLAICVLGLIAGRAEAQQVPPAGQPEVFALMKTADKLVADKQVDEAIPLLWRAEARMSDLESLTTRVAMRSAVLEQLRKIDPLDGKRREARQAAADKLLGLARSYRRRKWYAMALELLDDADRLDDGCGEKERSTVESALARLQPEPAAPVPEAAPPSSDLLQTMKPIEILGEWKRNEDGYRSPKLEGDTVMLLAESPTHGDHALAIDVKMGAAAGQAGLIFGMTDADNFHVAEVHTFPEHRSASIVIHRVTGRYDVQTLVQRGFVLQPEQCADWLRIAVQVQGQQVAATVNGKGRVQVKCPTVPHGSVGLFVSGASPNKNPVQFRELRIGALPEDDDDTATGELKTVVVATPEATVQARIAEAEAMIGRKHEEAAVLTLREARRELERVQSEVVRRALATAIDQLIKGRDPLATSTAAKRREIAELLTAVGRRYLDEKRPFSARAVLEEAQSYDAATPAEALTTARDLLKPILRKRRGLPAEPEVAVDNTAGKQWFEGGRQHFSTGWAWRDSWLASPNLNRSAALHATKRKLGSAGNATVQVRLRETASAGLAFGVRSRYDYHIAAVIHGPKDSVLVIARRYKGAWEDLAQQRVRFSPEARANWMTIAVTFEKGKVVGRFGLAKPLEAVNASLKPRGTLGLYAWSDRGVGSVEFRNFAAADRPADENAKGKQQD